jgi:hypothetical protein
MKFRGNWSVPHDNWLPVLKKFTSMSPQEQTNAGEGVKIIGRWHDLAARTGVIIFESDDLRVLPRSRPSRISRGRRHTRRGRCVSSSALPLVGALT